MALPPGTSRHRPDWGFHIDPSACATQDWAPVPLQVQSWTRVPSTVPLPETSRHLPIARSDLSGFGVQSWASVPLQV